MLHVKLIVMNTYVEQGVVKNIFYPTQNILSQIIRAWDHNVIITYL